MKRLNKTNAWLLGLVTVLAVGCGSEDKPATDTTSPTDSSEPDAAPPAETSEPGDTTAGPDETDPGPTNPSGDLGDPVLEDVPPETELSDLDEEQLAEVCEAYVKTSEAVSANLGALCPTQGLFQASQSADVTDDESYQAECAEQVEACELQIAATQEDSPAERCENGAACGASVQDFNDCNAQIAALNRLVLEPLTESEVPECSETTQTQASSTALVLGIRVAAGLNAVTAEAGGSPTDQEGPCARISEACPELGVALGAFSDLASQLP
jgi:hypothetical protein